MSDTEGKQSARDWPENERKVWAERYPDGDLQIEIGRMENVETLYLQSGEAESLRNILDELYDEEDSP